ncbi:alanine racemase [Humitalea rosea]|uniref:Alanine racemase n=1 Tax=Humitalea rosea TaxID=990373 RepID=A0A2W7I7Z2_9PROT|nr:alanine racemase [Humitalea rosea]PZW42278.1 alanine racemase [Humitalea rosea]
MLTEIGRGRLTVNLGAIIANWRLLGAMHPGQTAAAVMKADAYGLGAAAIGPALRDAGCRHFFVAHRQEGVALRQAIGPGPMIAVLNGFAPDDSDLVPVLNSLPDVNAWSGMGREAILHLDTGMARLGLDAAEQMILAGAPSLRQGIVLRFVMTHLCCADEPAHPLNEAQQERFAAACAPYPDVPRSLANSSGLFLGAGYATALARPGAALYGLNPTPGQPNPMQPVVTLEAPILQIRQVRTGESVGYGAAWTATRPSCIATVAAGYADGYLRALSGRGWAILAGRRVPLVGRVSMDLLTFDATDGPEPAPGEMITLMGKGVAPDDLGHVAGTIGYEMLTSLGARYDRAWVA